MIIRCPQCEHSRSIPEGKIPATAELATCPRCKHRFRFRVLEKTEEALAPAPETEAPQAQAHPAEPVAPPIFQKPAPQRPQSAFRENAEHNETDLWDAVDALGQHWEKQTDRQNDQSRSQTRAAQAAGRPADHPLAAPARHAEHREPAQAAKHASSRISPAPANAQTAAPRQPAPENAAHTQHNQTFTPEQAQPGPAQARAAQAAQQAHMRQEQIRQDQIRQEQARQEQARQEQSRQTQARPVSKKTAQDPRRPVQGWLDISLPQADAPSMAGPEASGPEPLGSETFTPEASGREHCVPDDLERAKPEQYASEDTAHGGGLKKTTGPRPTVFPYADDGPPPEERVEQHMRMLQDTHSADRPTRHLGMLKDYGDTPGQQAAGQERERVLPPMADADEAYGNASPEDAPEESGIPWENPARNGWFKGFVSTLQGVMFRGPEFFSGITGGGSLVPGYIFFLVMGYVAILSTLAWVHATTVLLPPEVVTLPDSKVALPLMLLLAPLALGLMLLFVTGCIRVFLRLFAPDRANFGRVYKVTAYAFAPLILSVVPIIGPVIGGLWFLAAIAIGCRHTLKLPWGLAVPLSLLPAAILGGGIFYLFFA